MNKKLISLMAAALALLSASGQVSFTNVGKYPVIEVTPDISTGLDKIYVVYDTEGVGMTLPSSTGERPIWQTYDWQGGTLHIDTIPGVQWNGYSTTLTQVIPNTGYKIVDGTKPFYCWVVNYADYFLELNDMSINNEAPCSLLTFNIDGHGDAIPYYTVNGSRQVLDRMIKLEYNTLEWDDSTHWQEKAVVESFAALDQGVEILPPLCNTEFLLTGDCFLEEWGIGDGIEGEYYYTKAVGCGSTAIIRDDDDTETKLDGELTNGSAPVYIIFTGYPTDGVVFREWEVATDPDFENVILQYNQDEFDYTFIDAGNYYVRYMVANSDGTCEAYGNTYTINVSESSLGSGPRGDLPNAFSPGSTEGVNDVWKVTYKSLVEFHCWIFNRWGTLVYEYTDPDGGWDGTYRGKLVDTGVYYYVITAEGSDGVKYKKRGDISILRYKKRGSGTEGGGGIDSGGVY